MPNSCNDLFDQPNFRAEIGSEQICISDAPRVPLWPRRWLCLPEVSQGRIFWLRRSRERFYQSSASRDVEGQLPPPLTTEDSIALPRQGAVRPQPVEICGSFDFHKVPGAGPETRVT